MLSNSKIRLLGGVSVVILILAVSIPMIGHAHGKGWGKSRGPSPEEMICRLDTRLNLSPEQKDKLVPIIDREVGKRHKMFVEHRKEMDRLRAEFHAKMEKERQNTEKEIASVLTEDQQDKFQKLMDERKERFKERHQKKHWRGETHGPRGCW